MLNAHGGRDIGREIEMGELKRVCVFCGSKSGNRQIFSDAALDLAKQLVERGMDLVYGGGSIGLMGVVSQAAHEGGCSVLGIIPAALVPVEISGHAVGQVLIVSSMHERKAEMARRADAFIALPGGYGTMEEMLEIITWSQLGIHDKPVGILNVDGYYDCLLGLFDKGVEEGFIKPAARNIIISATTAVDLLRKMEEYTPVHEQVAPRESWSKNEGFIRNRFPELELLPVFEDEIITTIYPLNLAQHPLQRHKYAVRLLIACIDAHEKAYRPLLASNLF